MFRALEIVFAYVAESLILFVLPSLLSALGASLVVLGKLRKFSYLQIRVLCSLISSKNISFLLLINPKPSVHFETNKFIRNFNKTEVIQRLQALMLKLFRILLISSLNLKWKRTAFSVLKWAILGPHQNKKRVLDKIKDKGVSTL